MAGETRGALAEAIAKVATEFAVMELGTGESVFWEESPSGSVIKPDLTTGTDKDRPTNLILITATDSVKDSEKKYWRNLGEIFDAKSRLMPAPAVLNLIFKSEIKPELMKLTSALCDSTHHADRDPIHGPDISRWLESNHNAAPSNKASKEVFVRQALLSTSKLYDAAFAKALECLAKTLTSQLYMQRTELVPLWEVLRTDLAERKTQPVRRARLTLVRRGIARWLVFDNTDRERVFRAHILSKPVPRSEIPTYAKPLGMLGARIGGAHIPPTSSEGGDMISTVGSDLRVAARYYKDAADGDVDVAESALRTSVSGAPAEMLRVAQLLRAMPDQVSSWHSYVLRNWSTLITTIGCYSRLVECHRDPTGAGAVSFQEDGRVWIYDHLVAMLRANAGMNNTFGYGALISYLKTHMTDPELTEALDQIISSLSGTAAQVAKRWVSNTLLTAAEPGRRGFQDWLSGTKAISPVIIAAFSFSLSRMLRQIQDPEKIALEELVAAHAYGLWNKLLTYQDFEPLLGLIEAACGDKVTRTAAPTVMTELVDETSRSTGWMPALAFEEGLIYWKSVTDAGKGHKRKELSARARALRFERSQSQFRRRPAARRLLLVVDGTFDDSDLRVLSESGWDAIFYPDEMNDLIRAVE